jgi:anti-sigma regulatory factor (Ser/Thr protein kinase)
MTDTFFANISNQFGELARITPRVDQFLESGAVSSEAAFMVHFVLEEMLTNIIKYGYDDREVHEIEVKIERLGKNLRVTLTDDGHEFNPLVQSPPDFSKPIYERDRGGLGIFLIKDMTESIDYRRNDGRNVLEIVVKSQ